MCDPCPGILQICCNMIRNCCGSREDAYIMGSENGRSIPARDIETLKEQTAFSAKEIREWYLKFHQDYPSGVITREDFTKMYQEMFPSGDASELSEYIFKTYDMDKNGVISFEEFMFTLSISTRGSVDDKLTLAFKMYDLDGNGVVTINEATSIITAIYRMKGKGDHNEAEKSAIQLFLKLDRNQDDYLTEEEFVMGIKSNRDIVNILSPSFL